MPSLANDTRCLRALVVEVEDASTMAAPKKQAMPRTADMNMFPEQACTEHVEHMAWTALLERDLHELKDKLDL